MREEMIDDRFKSIIVVPLHSTRTDVERSFGKPNAEYGRYDIDNQEIEFFYSKGRCVNGWNVPEDTVIDIAVNPKQSPRMRDLKVDLSKFERFRDTNFMPVSNNTKKDKGIRNV